MKHMKHGTQYLDGWCEEVTLGQSLLLLELMLPCYDLLELMLPCYDYCCLLLLN